MDNVIRMVFEKIFDQKTMNGKRLLENPFSQIMETTFENDAVHILIHQLTKLSIEDIKKNLFCLTFQKKFLFDKLKKKNLIRIFFDEIIDERYIIDESILKSSIINNRLESLKKITQLKFKNELLMWTAEFGHEEIYFYLRESGLDPNSQTYYRAIIGGSMKIIKDISTLIGISNKILETAFEMNRTEVILHVVKEANKVNSNFMSYSIMNANFDVLEQLNHLIVWHEELYFSALLSGSMKMIKYVENKMNVHENHVLDTSKSGSKGEMSLLSEEMIYEHNGKNYFSHTVNYAIQSDNLEIIKYIVSLGYRVTSSNVITAIKTGDPEIALYIAQQHGKKLGSHFIYYFGLKSYITNKFKIAKVLIDAGYLDLHDNTPKQLNDYRRETLHQKIIDESTTYIDTNNVDIDYLMNYHIFFKQDANLIKTRIAIELGMAIKWQHNDAIYLFGDLNLIKKHCMDIPDIKIIMETLCYRQFGKLCYLIQTYPIFSDLIVQLCPVITMLSDPLLDSLVKKFDWNMKRELRYLLMARKDFDYNDDLTIEDIKEILLTEDLKLIRQLNIQNKIDNNLLWWIQQNDLIDILLHLNIISDNNINATI